MDSGIHICRNLRVVLALTATALAACGVPRGDEWATASWARPASAGRPDAPAAAASAVASETVAGRALFARSCASCHGEDGSGQGAAVLERPARNFKDGGFSFGNTADAIFNTITHGIPGTPMPGFGDALGEPERRLLADYVRTLGPPIEDVDEAETILAVTEESGPRSVRGILPPIVEGAPIRPRGLLIGLPGGLSFEYRIDDVRLLGVRQGGFVARTDWGGRGGTPLQPLGGLIWMDGDGDPEATFALESGAADGATESRALTARLYSSGDEFLSYELLDAGRASVGVVIDGVGPVNLGSLAGFERGFMLHEGRVDGDARLRIRVTIPADSLLVDSFSRPDADGTTCEWRVVRRLDGVHECIGVSLTSIGSGPQPATVLREAQGSLEFVLALRPASDLEGGPITWIRVRRLFTTEWTASHRVQLEAEAP